MASKRLGVLGAIAIALLFAGVVAQANGHQASRARAAEGHCLSAQLAVRLGRPGVAAGHIGQEVSFRNGSRTTCTLDGYPDLQMLGAGGLTIHTEVLHGTAYTVPAVSKRLVILAPRAMASFDLGYDDGTGYGLARCPTSARVEITPPNDHRPITVSWRLQPYGGSVTHLRCGRITVSPVFGGR
jgi:uncharacterized protein DUF4232